MAVTKTLVYITCLCFARDFVFCDDYEEIGKDFILTPRIRGKPEDILWKHNENKVLEYDGSKVDEYGSFRGRVVVDFETGQLTIQKLNSQDSGQYQADIVINGKVQSSSHTLTVLDALVEPQVSCELDETSDVKKLLCSVEPQTQLSYEWSGPNINGHSGPELVVDEQEENLDSVYTCTVKNRVNSKSTDFTLKDCHTGQGQTPFSNATTESVPGSSDAIATLPSHNRLPSQKEPIANKKWYQDNKPGDLGETEELLKGTNSLQELNLKQSPQSDVIETNQENTGKGDEGELKYEKNSENAFEAEGNTYSKPDETEKERHEPLQSQEEKEKEKSQILKQEGGEKSPEHQNERLEEKETEDNNEDNQTPGQTKEAINRPDTGSSDVTLPSHTRLTSQPVADRKRDEDKEPEDLGETDERQKMSEQNLKQSPQSVSETTQENTGKGNEEEVDKESHNPLQSQKEEKKERSQILKQESEYGEKSPEHQNKGLEEKKTEDNNEDKTRPDTEINMDNEAEQVHVNEKKSQNDDGEQSLEQQNESPRNQKTEDAANSGNDMRPGDTTERSEEKNNEGIDGPNTAETCNRPSVDQPVDGEAPSAPAVIDSPANMEKEPINSSVASSSQPDLYNYTGQDKEEERKRPGLDQDEKGKVVTNQEEKGGQEQMAEEKNHEPEISEEKSRINFNKQTAPDSTINTVSQMR
ncbi:hypothetical protein DPX16_7029 [Anabarilius grahami]|uniref:Ig-like domain-containing protein n=1 Tax=Anabarilius grahami TaxID=495550 RepID=A0A3N0Z4L9_ANAGA|nr:hypothetical protein DPX16_7029 [Anabarilius grahami]